jgi:thioredoxin
MLEHLDKESFKTRVFDWETEKEWKYRGDKPAILDFYADWCGPCKMIAPVLDELSRKYEGKLEVYKINTDEEPELSSLFQISSVPTLFFVPLGEEPQFALGALPKPELERVVREVLKVE